MSKPLVLLDVPLLPFMQAQVEPLCEMCPWALLKNGDRETLSKVQGMYTYAHPIVDGALLDQLPALIGHRGMREQRG